MVDLERPEIVTIKKHVDHQGIGGKRFILEKVGNIDYFLGISSYDLTPAEFNFIMRRDILKINPDLKIYYGHVLDTNLGYFIVEDEIVNEDI